MASYRRGSGGQCGLNETVGSGSLQRLWSASPARVKLGELIRSAKPDVAIRITATIYLSTYRVNNSLRSNLTFHIVMIISGTAPQALFLHADRMRGNRLGGRL